MFFTCFGHHEFAVMASVEKFCFYGLENFRRVIEKSGKSQGNLTSSTSGNPDSLDAALLATQHGINKSQTQTYIRMVLKQWSVQTLFQGTV